MTTVLPSLCMGCSRRVPDTDPQTGTVLANRCDAYPGGIPRNIINGADHRVPRGDEHDGLTYEPIEDEALAQRRFAAWQAFAAA